MKRINPLLFAIAMVLAGGAVDAHGDKRGNKGEHGGHARSIGKPGDPGQVSRSVEIDMQDTMRFIPSHIDVRRGETIRFVVKNSGKVRHEMVLGSLNELKDHARLMRKFPDMEHDDPNQVQVDPGKTGELIWHFTKGGRFDFACLQPGHFEAGMAGKVAVK